jgi:Transposase DDE domain
LRRRLRGDLAVAENAHPLQKRLSFAEIDRNGEAWEYAALVTSLAHEILTLGQLYRDRADCENAFDELKNQWGWGGFTTQDLKRCRLLAGVVALVYNWWSLFVRLAEPDHHREAITTRPLLLTAVARRTQHAGQVKLTVSSTHASQRRARRAYVRIARFLTELRQSAEQLDALQRWYRILSEALRSFLKGRQLDPPRRLNPA